MDKKISNHSIATGKTVDNKVFVPHSESLQQTTGVLGELVPFSLDYVCLRLLDGTYAFTPRACS